jgi:hypothetical protein
MDSFISPSQYEEAAWITALQINQINSIDDAPLFAFSQRA